MKSHETIPVPRRIRGPKSGVGGTLTPITPPPTRRRAKAARKFSGVECAARKKLPPPPGPRPHERLTDGGAGGARQAHHRKLHTAVRDDESKQLLAQAMLANECEHRAEHQAVEPENVQRAEAEEESGAVGEQADDDVVGQY